jgi:hypothetical protein
MNIGATLPIKTDELRTPVDKHWSSAAPIYKRDGEHGRGERNSRHVASNTFAGLAANAPATAKVVRTPDHVWDHPQPAFGGLPTAKRALDGLSPPAMWLAAGSAIISDRRQFDAATPESGKGELAINSEAFRSLKRG